MKSKLLFLSFAILFAIIVSSCSCGEDAAGNGVQDTSDALNQDVIYTDANPDGSLSDTTTSSDTGEGDAVSDISNPNFEVSSISPEAGYRGVDIDFIISGKGFLSGLTVTFINEEVYPLYEESATIIEVNDTTIKGRLVANLERPLGLYDVKVTNPDKDFRTLKKAFRVLISPPPVITDIEPKTGFAGDPLDGKNSDVMITIYGDNFVSTPTVRFISKKDANKYYISPSVAFHSSKNITAVVPTESYKMEVGDYTVEVINPDKQSGFYDKFTVTSTPSPIIISVNPFRMPANTGADPFIITGENFMDGAKVYAISGDTDIELTIKSISSTQIDAIILPNQLALGYYPIKVINPDGQYDIFYAIQIMSSAEGKLTQWSAISSKLVEWRFRHSSVFFRDQYKNPYILVAGGNNLIDTLDSVEIAPVLFSGELGEFKKAVQFNPSTMKRDFVRLNTKRQDFGLVRIKDRIIAIGGFDGTNSLDTIEIAKVNSRSDAPKVLRPSFTSVTGSLPYGSWYYKISAVFDDGESLPSREIILPNTSGTVTLKWMPVAGALYYNIYRSPSSDGISGSERLIATGIKGVIFNDDGEGTLTPAPSRVNAYPVNTPDATLGEGIYKYVVTAKTANFETTQSYEAIVEIKAGQNSVKITWDKIKSAVSYNLYRTENGKDSFYLLKSDIKQNEYIDTGADSLNKNISPPEIIKPLERGSIRYFKPINTKLNTPREGLRAIYIKSIKGDDIVYVIGGRRDENNYLNSVEKGIFKSDINDFEPFVFDKPTNINRAYFGIASNFISDENDFPSGEDDEPPITPYCEDTNTEVAFIEIAPVFKIVNPNDKVQYEAIARDITGCIIRGIQVNWNSSDTSIATIDGNGLATALKSGTTYITAIYKTITSNKATLIVQEGEIEDVFSIVVKPEYATKKIGEQQQYTAEAFDRNGNKLNISNFIWNSDNPSVATINSTGLATALNKGRSGITASYNNVTSNVALLEVTGDDSCEVKKIEIEPALAGILVGQTLQYKVKAFDANNNQIAYNNFGFFSTDPNVATIDASGLATGKSVGTTGIYATACGVLSNKAILNVSSNQQCKFAKIVISPEDSTIEIMEKQTYYVTGFDSCGNVVERNDYIFKSSDETIAVMNGNVATGIGLGVTYITAEADGIISNQAKLTVIKQRLESTPVFIYIVGGDDSYTAGNNSGIKSIEYSQVDENGNLINWNIATESITKGVVGVEAQLYAGFLFVFGGVQSESGSSYNSSNTVERFPANPNDGSLGKKENTGAQLNSSRGYFSIVRIPPFIYAIGGVSGNTLVNTIERIPQ